jgi:hypothetical protein
MDAIDIDNNADTSVANPNLVVTFSDNESDDGNESFDGGDIESYRKQVSLPYPSWFVPLSWELRNASDGDKSDDYKPATIYNFDDQTFPLGTRIIVIHHPMSMDDIKDHPAYWFLKEIEAFNQNPLKDDNRSELALLAAKILHYAKTNGLSDCPSWTLAKDVPDCTLQEIIDITDKAREPNAEINASLTIQMAQHHIFYMATWNLTIPRSTSKT